jgi:hypothetical protein
MRVNNKSMANHRLLKSVTISAALLAPLLFTACSGIDSGNVQRSSTCRLSPNPPVIIVEPFEIENASFLVKRSGSELEGYKRELPTAFQSVLVERLQKISATKRSWTEDTLPERGWLVRGEFLKINSGSGILRDTIGFGVGKSTFTTRVYIYDLAISKTHYIVSFDTGVGEKNGSGVTPGSAVIGGSAGAVAYGAGASGNTALNVVGPATAGTAMAYTELSTRPFPSPTQASDISPVTDQSYANQYQDMARTARQIRDQLVLMSNTPTNDKERVALANSTVNGK